MRPAIVLTTVVLVHSWSVLAAADSIGSVRTYKPEAVILHKGEERTVDQGASVNSGDVIITRRTGAVGVVFLDGSVLSLGPSTEFVIEEFTFEPDEKDVSFLTRLQKGTATFLSGAIGRISPDSVKCKTPTATLGLRGTKVLIEVQ
jgi:hypothetical protein